MIKCNAESALGDPGDMSGNATNIAQFQFNLVAPLGEYRCFLTFLLNNHLLC